MMLRWTITGFLFIAGFVQVANKAVEPPPESALQCSVKIQTNRARHLKQWKPQMKKYSQRHYGENTWQLDPKALILHYTVSRGFPWNLVRTKAFAGETPGLAVHYVVDEKKVWEILPPNVRSRGAYGINHRAINIEMVAMNAADLAKKKHTRDTTRQLVKCLMREYQIPKHKIYSHEMVSKMDPKIVPGVKDLVNGKPYHKIDPGKKNMSYITGALD